ncbi:MAG: NAD nucleotidase [Candidatus Puniceispirillaceae bacterium]
MKHLKNRAISAIMASLLCAAGQALAGDLTILHINDHHSHLEADGGLDLVLGDEKTRVRSGGFPALVTKFKELEAANQSVLKLHAGDAISGDLYYTLFKGEADAALMNEVCFDAFALGNHEFDDGDAGLKRFLDYLNDGSCNTAILGANVKPEVGVSPLTKQTATDYIIPHVIIERGGMKIGIIGIDIANKTKMSSSPDETTIFTDETITAQAEINILKAKGINHIILLTHYQYENDIALAPALSGVDVIIGGDSHSLLGDFSALGQKSEGPYPTVSKDSDGNQVCIAQAWQYSQILGELQVSFDDKGNVTDCSGTPHMMLADSFRRKNADGQRVELDGTARDAAIATVNAHPNLSIVAEDESAAVRLAGFAGQVDELKQTIIGKIASPLCLERIPGQGRSKICQPADTAKNGSDISNLVAHAFRVMSRTGDIAIQNGGGVRIDVAAGDYSIGDAYQLLPFANTLVELQMTGAEIHQVLEEALDYALTPDGSTGAYPYAAGLRWHIDASKPKGKRFSAIEFKGPLDKNWSALDKKRSYKVITNNYIAGGRDGYLTFKTVSDDGRLVDTYLDYAQSFVDYVSAKGIIEKLPLDDYSTQSYVK